MGCSHDRVDVDGQAAPSCILVFRGRRRRRWWFRRLRGSVRTFATKGVSYRARVANACCFAAGIVGVNVVVAEREAREDVDVREVVVPCERMEDRSEMEVCGEGGRERGRGRGGYGCGVATVAAEGRIGGGGGRRRVLVSERQELLAEGVRVKTGESTLEATGYRGL